MKQIKIPWIVYALIGGGIVYLVERLDDPKLTLFLIIGYIFVAVAIFKLLFWFIIHKGTKKEEKQAFSGQQYQQRQPVRRLCRNCGSPVIPGARFCQNCGAPLV